MVAVKALMQAAKNTTAPSCEERMALYNSRRGDLTGYDCPICRNKGFVFLMKDGYEYTMECECMEKRRGKWRLQKSGLQDMAERYRSGQGKRISAPPLRIDSCCRARACAT